MSTHSFIGIIKKDGILHYVYCHSDGYPSYLGAMLLKHYNSQKLAEALINLGNLSMVRERLAPNEGEHHSFETPVRHGPNGGVTTAYHRDRNEPLEIYHESVDTSDVSVNAKTELLKILKEENITYGYLYDSTEKKWYAVDTLQDCGFNLLNRTYISTHS